MENPFFEAAQFENVLRFARRVTGRDWQAQDNGARHPHAGILVDVTDQDETMPRFFMSGVEQGDTDIAPIWADEPVLLAYGQHHSNRLVEMYVPSTREAMLHVLAQPSQLLAFKAAYEQCKPNQTLRLEYAW